MVMKFSTVIDIDSMHMMFEGQGHRSKDEVTRSKILIRTMQNLSTLNDEPLNLKPQNLVC